jgi:hypothetical protein
MLFSHRLADYAANPVSSGGGTTVYTSRGVDSSVGFPVNTAVGDICFHGIYCVYGRPQAITPSAGWTQLSIRVYSGLAVALYAKVLDSTDISRGNTGFTFDNLYTCWTLAVKGTNPFTSFTTTGLATAGSNSSTKPSLAMTTTTENSGIILSHLMWNATSDNGIDADYIISNASNTVSYYQVGGRAQGQRHNIALELTRSSDSTTARTSSSLPTIGTARDYTETILCLNGVE